MSIDLKTYFDKHFTDERNIYARLRIEQFITDLKNELQVFVNSLDRDCEKKLLLELLNVDARKIVLEDKAYLVYQNDANSHRCFLFEKIDLDKLETILSEKGINDNNIKISISKKYIFEDFLRKTFDMTVDKYETLQFIPEEHQFVRNIYLKEIPE